MKPLVNTTNVVKISEYIDQHNIDISHIPTEKKHKTIIILKSFKQALEEFKHPTPEKISPIDQFDRHILALISVTQAMFELLNKNAQREIIDTFDINAGYY